MCTKPLLHSQLSEFVEVARELEQRVAVLLDTSDVEATTVQDLLKEVHYTP